MHITPARRSRRRRGKKLVSELELAVLIFPGLTVRDRLNRIPVLGDHAILDVEEVVKAMLTRALRPRPSSWRSRRATHCTS